MVGLKEGSHGEYVYSSINNREMGKEKWNGGFL